jgi:hypothetical protein
LQVWMALAVVSLALEVRASGDRRAMRLAGLCIGIAAATHPYLTLLFLPGALLIAGRSLLQPRPLLATIGFTLLAGTSYGLLALRGQSGGLIGWGDASSVAGFVDILLARAFQKSVTAPISSAGIADLVLFVAHQFGAVGGLIVPALAVAGLVVLGRRQPVVALGIAALVALGYASRGLWRFDGSTPDTAGYFGLATAMLCALVAVAGAKLTALRLPRPAPTALLTVAALGLAFSIGLPEPRDLESGTGREIALRALAPIEPGALVVLDDFNLLFMTWYLQAVENVRPDVTILFGGFLSQPWYQRRMETYAPEAAARLRQLPQRLDGPLYVDYGLGAGRLPGLVRAQLQPAGLLLRAGPSPAPTFPQSDWLVGRPDLDLQSRRALIWLHFRQACFQFERHDGAAWKWHADAIEALHPGIGLGDALARGDHQICEGGGT